MRSEFVAAWLLTVAMHVGALLLLAWLVDRWLIHTQLAWREWLWRIALFGGVLTASAPMFFGMPALARFVLPSSAATTPIAQTSVVSALPAPQLRSKVMAAKTPTDRRIALDATTARRP